MAFNVPSGQNNNKIATIFCHHMRHDVIPFQFPVSEKRCLASEFSIQILDLVFNLLRYLHEFIIETKHQLC